MSAFATTAAISATDAAADLFDRHLWQNRLLLVFSLSTDTESYRHMEHQLDAASAELLDRDLRIVRLRPDAPVTVDGLVAAESAAIDIYRRFEVEPNGFAVVLIGKDGGVKMKTARVPELDEIFSLIDSMPMRQLEMQQKNTIAD